MVAAWVLRIERRMRLTGPCTHHHHHRSHLPAPAAPNAPPPRGPHRHGPPLGGAGASASGPRRAGPGEARSAPGVCLRVLGVLCGVCWAGWLVGWAGANGLVVSSHAPYTRPRHMPTPGGHKTKKQTHTHTIAPAAAAPAPPRSGA